MTEPAMSEQGGDGADRVDQTDPAIGHESPKHGCKTERPSSPAALIAAWIVLLAAVGYYFWAMALPLAGPRHDNDFKHIWLGSRAMQAGLSPYPPESLLEIARRSGHPRMAINPYVYLPFTGQVLEPITRLRLEAASQAWYWINHGLLLATVVFTALTLPAGNRRLFTAAGMVALYALFHPLQRTLSAGQLTLVLTACTAATALLLQRRLLTAAGAVAAFATLFKLTPGLLLIPLWFYGGWRAMAGFFGAAVVFGGWSVWKSGWAMQLDFLPMLRSMGHGRSSWQEHGATFWKDEWNQSFNSLLTHLLVANNGKTVPWLDGPAWLANGLSQALALGFLIALIYVVRRDRMATDRTAQTETVSYPVLATHQTTLVALLIPALLWDHYLVAVVPTLAWLLASGWSGPCWLIRVLVLCAVVMGLSFNPESPSFRTGLGILLMSAKLWPVVVVAVLALAWTQIQSPSGEADKPSPAV